MNKKMIITIIFIVIIFALLISIYRIFFRTSINSDFATDVYIRVLDNDLNVSTISITDEDDIAELKKILRGHPFSDSPSCGFSRNVSVVMQNEDESIVFSLALDGCPLIQINDSNKFIRITEEQRNILDRIFEEHGMIFPFF